MAASIWIINILIDLPAHLGWGRHSYDLKLMMCFMDRLSDYFYVIFYVFTVCSPAMTIIFICYVKIFLQVQRSRKAVQQHGDAQAITPQEVKLVKTLFTVFIIFVICYGPWTVMILIDSKDQFPQWMYVLAVQMAHMNSSLNSIVYAASNKEFREGYKRVFMRCCGKGNTLSK